MRDLVLRNMTSLEKKRKIISSCEVSTSNGVKTRISRYFICALKNAETQTKDVATTPKIYIYKNHDTTSHCSRFLYKIKGNIFVVNQEQVYVVSYIHSFKLELTPNF
jgi:hypothetical protein